MRILGIDPGIAIVGFGVIEIIKKKIMVVGYGAITTSTDQSFAQRLLTIQSNMQSLIETYNPTTCGMEELYFSKNVKTAMAVSHARGVILCAVEGQGIPVSSYSPTTVKQVLTGYGAAEKKQMQYMVKETLHLKKIPKPDDVADALAVAVCHYYMDPLKS